jgi:hypothetical protein
VPATSAIVGRIVDENGEPVENANVRVEQVRWSAGRRRLENVAGIAARQTDDFGRYRIFGLLPGAYVVSAVVGQPVAGYEPNDLPGYVKTYYPGSFAVSDAQSVDVATGQDTLNVEFAIVRGQAASVSGRVVTAAGRPFAGAVHLVASGRSRAVASAPLRVRTEDGTFQFDRLAPGEYVVQAATARESPSVEGEFGMQLVTASPSALGDIVVRMSSGSSITGRIVFEGGSPPPQAEIRLSPVPADVDFTSLADNPVARARVHDNWTFEMGGVNGSRRLQVLQSPEGWMLSRVTVNGADVTDAPLVFGTSEQSLSEVEVVLTNRLTGVTGIVTGDGTRPIAGAMVVAFATDRTRWYAQTRYIAHGDTSDAGMFTLTVPPDSYYIAALEARDVPEHIDDIGNPDFLGALSANAARVTVGEGELAAARLRVAGR